MTLPTPSLSTRIRLALARRRDRRAARREEHVLFEARPLDPDALIEADRRAAIRFNLAILAALALAIAFAVVAWIAAPAATAIP